MRFRPVDYSGRMMVHCHWNQHADAGMMTSEHLLPSEDANESNSSCACEAWAAAPPEHPAVAPPNTICGRVECHEGDDDTITELIMCAPPHAGMPPCQARACRTSSPTAVPSKSTCPGARACALLVR